jgi:hypothetical protein
MAFLSLDDQPQQPNDGDSIQGLTIREYFIAHAPSEPQSWFEPVLPSAAGMWQVPDPSELNGQDKADWESEKFDYEPDSCSDTLKDFMRRIDDAYDAKKAYENECKKQRYIQWPIAWADAMIEALEANHEHN